MATYYELSIIILTDIDECVMHDCSDQEICINTPGTFTCECVIGYNRSGPGEQCEGELATNYYTIEASICMDTSLAPTADVDECSDNTLNSCHETSLQVCVNTHGSFECECEPGFQETTEGMCQGCRELTREFCIRL